MEKTEEKRREVGEEGRGGWEERRWCGREDEKWKRGEEGRTRRRGEECLRGLWSGCVS